MPVMHITKGILRPGVSAPFLCRLRGMCSFALPDRSYDVSSPICGVGLVLSSISVK